MSLFAFLAVLICTMGALMLLLLAVTREARVQAVRETAARAIKRQAEAVAVRQTVQLRKAQWRKSQQAAEAKLDQARLRTWPPRSPCPATPRASWAIGGGGGRRRSRRGGKRPPTRRTPRRTPPSRGPDRRGSSATWIAAEQLAKAPPALPMRSSPTKARTKRIAAPSTSNAAPTSSFSNPRA